jgi:aspartyl-tRNA(Asn)/glutamyl-tRNA(Gln) amidotransferase subunit A
MSGPPLWQATATELVAGFRDGRCTPTQALNACLERTSAVNPRLNAVVVLDTQRAAQAAAQSTARWRAGTPLSTLDGVPVTIKDNLHVKGLPTRWGSRAIEGLVPERDELPVARLRDAGAVIFGKTNVPEFTMQGYTDNPVFGPTGNPWNPALTPGGSSGGAVALVAAGGCPVALGTDGGGSIRRPASHTNLVGLKPSRGRVPRTHGLPPIFLDFEVAGPMARCVDDVAAVMQVIGREPVRDEPLRPARILYVPRFADHPVDPQIATLTDTAARNLAELGHTVTTAQRFDIAEAVNVRWPLLSQVGLAWLVEHAQELGHGPFDAALFGPAMQANAETGRAASARTLFELLYEVERLRAELARLFDQHDFLLTPAAAALPWPANETHPPRIAGREVGPRGHALFTAFANAAGLPGIAVPCGFAQGLPVGLQLVAREGADDALLALARQFERAHPWQRFPEL